MPSRPIRHPAVSPRHQAFWLGAAVLVAGQLFAFWTLCSQQVRQAEVRHAAMRVERLALADCLRSVPHATLTSCAQRRDGRAQALAAGPFDAAASAVPVNYVYR